MHLIRTCALLTQSIGHTYVGRVVVVARESKLRPLHHNHVIKYTSPSRFFSVYNIEKHMQVRPGDEANSIVYYASLVPRPVTLLFRSAGW